MPEPLPRYLLHLADAPVVERLDDAAPGSWPLARRDAALLAWLALRGPTPRAQLAVLLWPDSGEEAARNSLRQRLFQLRKLTGSELVQGQAQLRLATNVQHDLTEAEEILGQITVPECPQFDDWLREQREQRAQLRLRSLVQQADALEQAGEYAAAVPVAQAVLRHDQSNEEAHRRLMRVQYLSGDRVGALLAFDRLEQWLKHEVGTRPAPETLALLQTIERSDTEAATAPAPAYRAVPASMMRPPLMVGRQREWHALLSALAANAVPAVTGEAGMGKTRLLQALVVRRSGTVMASARPGDMGVPLSSATRLLRRISEWAAQHGASNRPAGDAPGDTPAGRADSKTLSVLQAPPSLATALQAVPGLLTLMMDDLHFADPASLDLLLALADGATPALRWVLAWRDADAGSPLQALRDTLADAGRLHPIAIHPLSAPELAELIDSLALPGVAGAAIAPALHRHSGGNPMFALETLKQAWADQSLAELSAEGAKLPRPPSVGRLIERRLQQLSAGALTLARVAAIAGVDFDIALAEAVLATPALQLADALNELEAAHLMHDAQFVHDLVFDAVRAGIPAAIARHTQAQVAAWLERPERAPAPEPARIAQHWLDAAQPLRALPWLQRAAEHAARALRVREQCEFLQTQSRIEADAGQVDAAFVSQLQAAEVYCDSVSRDALADSQCDRLDVLAHTPAQQVQATLQRAHLIIHRGDLQAGEALAREALWLSEASAEPALTVRSRDKLATALIMQDRPAQALEYCQGNIAWVDAHGDTAERGELHGNLAVLYDNLGRVADALVHHQQAIALAREAHDDSNLATLLCNLACNRTDAGRLPAASALLLESFQLITQHEGFGGSSGNTCAMLAMCCGHEGAYADALQWCERAQALMNAHLPGYVGICLAHRANVWGHLGQWARMRQEVQAIEALPAPTLTIQVRTCLLRHLLGLQAGRTTGHELDQALALIEGKGRPDLRLPIQIAQARCAAPAQGLMQLQQVIDEARALGHLGTEMSAHIAACDLLARGDAPPAAAKLHSDAALVLASEHRPVSLYRAELWLHAGRALDAAGQDAQAHALWTEGAAWVSELAQRQVPAEFRPSFLQRNLVNAQLLQLAKRHAERQTAG
jgi:DNA-binding SARP family transcriptional activator/tetratricopeptide (TPR) repeat protein